MTDDLETRLDRALAKGEREDLTVKSLKAECERWYKLFKSQQDVVLACERLLKSRMRNEAGELLMSLPKAIEELIEDRATLVEEYNHCLTSLSQAGLIDAHESVRERAKRLRPTTPRPT